MAIIYKDCIKQSTQSSDLDDIIIDTDIVYQGYRTFDTALSTGDQCYYLIDEKVTGQWEVGLGTFTAPTGLSRDSIIQSSNNNTKIDVIAGSNPEISITAPASVFQSLSNIVTSGRTSLVAEHEVTGSATDTISFSGLDLNTDIGWTIVAEIVFDAGTASEFSMKFNDIADTLASYASRFIYSTSATVTTAQNPLVGNPCFATDGTASRVSCFNCNISSVNLYALVHGEELRNNAAQSVVVFSKMIIPQTNITQIEFYRVSGSATIGVGSKIKIYRWSV